MLGALFALTLLACDGSWPRHGRQHDLDRPGWARAFTVARGSSAAPILCTLGARVDPVSGALRGDADADGDQIWLETQDGRRLHVIWPGGFTVRFAPAAVLYDDRGVTVATDSPEIKLGQVSLADALGSADDPYVVAGLVFDGCYPYIQPRD